MLWKLELSKLCRHPNFSLKVSGGLLDNLVPGDVYHVVLQHVIFAIKGLRYFNCWKVGQTL